ncbi:hypothetical protein, partial [Phenylobacterium sp.]|uniref:hypothetical protein n=1 Tax=Phenylobacterium sp. TaxID=1871053 RepID=UPI002DE458E1|nr:hypothetical protein [Phenylobacterium sp.]
MDIHKPRPWHGWREFAKEYAIIVLGVLTALAGEQLVEHIHEGRLAAEARENVRQEMVETFVQFDKRKSVQACITARLDEIQALLRSAGTPGYRPPSWIGRPQLWNTLTDRWEAAAQAGRASLFDPDEQARYSQVYTSLKNAAAAEGREQQAWAQLRALQDEPSPSPTLVATLKLALQQA